jgi:hypothetical protein
MPEAERREKATWVAIVQRALAQRDASPSEDYLYKKLWDQQQNKKCGSLLYCRDTVRFDSLVSVVFHKPYNGEVESVLRSILQKALSKIYDRQFVIPELETPLLVCRSTDFNPHLNPEEHPRLYVVVGFSVKNPPYSEDERKSLLSIVNGVRLLDPWKMTHVDLALPADEIVKSLQGGQIVFAIPSERTDELSSVTFASADEVAGAQLQFQKKMGEITSRYASRAAKIPTVELPSEGMMMLSGNLGYRAEDLTGLWTETRQLLVKASTGAGLSGMSAYIVRFFPQNPYPTSGVVSADKGRALIGAIGTFISKINVASRNETEPINRSR